MWHIVQTMQLYIQNVKTKQMRSDMQYMTSIKQDKRIYYADTVYAEWSKTYHLNIENVKHMLWT